MRRKLVEEGGMQHKGEGKVRFDGVLGQLSPSDE